MEENTLDHWEEIPFSLEEAQKNKQGDNPDFSSCFFPFLYPGKEEEREFMVHALNPIALAYIGDAIYELMFRSYVVHRYGGQKIYWLHKKGVAFANASSQAKALRRCWEKGMLSEVEWGWVKKGRNQHSIPPKNASPVDYRYATGFETLLGMLYVKGDIKRIQEIVEAVVCILEEENQHAF